MFTLIQLAAGGAIGLVLIRRGALLLRKDLFESVDTQEFPAVKVLYQTRKPDLEPIADDVASLGLDLLLSQGRYRRGSYNPFLLGY